MRQRTWLILSIAFIGVVAGVLVFRNYLDAKPEKKDPPDPALRKAGEFEGERALAYVKALCDLGPRVSGSEGMAKQQEFLQKYFEKLGAKVTLQKFERRQVSRDQAVPLANMIISWHPESKTRVIICGHYDTRPIADQENSRRDWTKPFVSANDGTSSVAFMMELGSHMKKLKTEIGVDFVIFDGEEYIFDVNRDRYFLGSEHFAAEYKNAKDGPKYKAAILLDLFAGIGAEYKMEQNSVFFAGGLVEDVWNLAEELGVKSFVKEQGPNVLDDHLALNRAGIPAIDIIDFDYPHWHRLSDTPDKCSAVSMANVAKVIMAWLKKVK